MSYTEFYINSSGNNLNAGSTCSDVGGGSNSAIYTSTGGNFDGTSIFTPTDGSTPASTVTVGDYVSLYNTGDTVARAVAQVTAVGAGVNGTITVSTTAKYGTFPTSNSGSRALKDGGALAGLLPFVNTPGSFQAGVVPQSTRFNWKAGTFTSTTSAYSWAMGGSGTVSCWIRGYKNTPGDQDGNFNPVAGTDVPLITFTSGSVTIETNGNIKFSSVAFTSSSSTTGAFSVGTSNQVELWLCSFTSTYANIAGRAANLFSGMVIAGCSFTASTTAASIVAGTPSNSFILGCTFNGGIVAPLSSSTNWTVDNCVFYNQAGDVVTITTGSGAFTSNSIYSPVGNGVNITGSPTTHSLIANNYFSTVNQASKAAINNTSGTNSSYVVLVGNAYYNCTANFSGITDNVIVVDNGTLASEAFIAPTASPPNFAIGAVGQGLAFPGKFFGTTAFRGYLNVGAVQSQATIPGATAYAF